MESSVLPTAVGPTSRISGGLYDIFELRDDWFVARLSCHSESAYAPVSPQFGVFRQEVFDCSVQMPLFAAGLLVVAHKR